MNSIHFFTLFCFTVLLSSCADSKKQNEELNTREEHLEKHHNNKDKNHSDVNEYMHQSSVEELIERFESPERDSYQHPDKVLEYLGDISNKKIMDIGAGSGYFSVKLAEKGAKVIAADVNDEFQMALKKRVEENSIENIELRKIPFDNPGLSKKEVDIVLIVNTYHHIDDRSVYFSKVKKGIKENGELVVIDFYKKELPVGPNTDHKISKDVVIKELQQAAFTIVEVNVDLLPYQYIIRAK